MGRRCPRGPPPAPSRRSAAQGPPLARTHARAHIHTHTLTLLSHIPSHPHTLHTPLTPSHSLAHSFSPSHRHPVIHSHAAPHTLAPPSHTHTHSHTQPFTDSPPRALTLTHHSSFSVLVLTRSHPLSLSLPSLSHFAQNDSPLGGGMRRSLPDPRAERSSVRALSLSKKNRATCSLHLSQHCGPRRKQLCVQEGSAPEGPSLCITRSHPC